MGTQNRCRRRRTPPAATVNQYLAAGLIDELRLEVAPVLCGRRTFIADSVQYWGRQSPGRRLYVREGERLPVLTDDYASYDAPPLQ
jgi:hypothetical protein